MFMVYILRVFQISIHFPSLLLKIGFQSVHGNIGCSIVFGVSQSFDKFWDSPLSFDFDETIMLV